MQSAHLDKLLKTSATIALILALSACGGGGGTNSTPAPTPSPIPTPSPSPSPTASYDSLSTLTQAKAFTAPLARVDFRTKLNAVEIVDFVPVDLSNNVDARTGIITYDRLNGSYKITTSVGEKLFTPSDLGARHDDITLLNSADVSYEVYTSPIPDPNSNVPYNDDRLIVFNPKLPRQSNVNPNYTDYVDLSYTKFVEWRHMAVTMLSGQALSNNIFEQRTFAVLGIPTTDADMPRSGQANYTTYAHATYVRSGPTDTGAPLNVVDLRGLGTFHADFGSGVVQARLDLSKWVTNNQDFSFGTLAGAGNIGAANVFSGQLTGSNGAEGYTGSYVGGFFGPAAKEIGYTFSASSVDSRVAGAAVGLKK